MKEDPKIIECHGSDAFDGGRNLRRTLRGNGVQNSSPASPAPDKSASNSSSA